MYLDKEAFNSRRTTVFAILNAAFLKENGPWNPLIYEKNIEIQSSINKAYYHINSLRKSKLFWSLIMMNIQKR